MPKITTVGELKHALKDLEDDTDVIFMSNISGESLVITDLLLTNTLDVFEIDDEEQYRDVIMLISDRCRYRI